MPAGGSHHGRDQAIESVPSDTSTNNEKGLPGQLKARNPLILLVELRGFEPLTS